MTSRPVFVGARTTRIAVLVVITCILGCSRTERPAPTASVAPANPPQAATTVVSVAHKESVPAESVGSSNVRLQPASADEFKKLVADQKGKVVLVDFWATWCGPCREKFPHTLALAKKYGGDGLTVISVCMDSPDPKDQEKALRFLKEQKAEIINLSNRIEDQDAAFGAFDIDGGALPHFKIIDRKGNVRRKFGGDPDHPFGDKDIDGAVVAALREK